MSKEIHLAVPANRDLDPEAIARMYNEVVRIVDGHPCVGIATATTRGRNNALNRIAVHLAAVIRKGGGVRVRQHGATPNLAPITLGPSHENFQRRDVAEFPARLAKMEETEMVIMVYGSDELVKGLGIRQIALTRSPRSAFYMVVIADNTVVDIVDLGTDVTSQVA